MTHEIGTNNGNPELAIEGLDQSTVPRVWVRHLENGAGPMTGQGPYVSISPKSAEEYILIGGEDMIALRDFLNEHVQDLPPEPEWRDGDIVIITEDGSVSYVREDGSWRCVGPDAVVRWRGQDAEISRWIEGNPSTYRAIRRGGKVVSA